MRVGGDGHGDTVRVDNISIVALGLQPDDVPFAVRESDDFGFERGTIAWSLDCLADVNCFIKVSADDVVRLFVGIGGMAQELVRNAGDCGVRVAERLRRVVSGLRFKPSVVDGLSRDSRGCASLEAAEGETCGAKGIAQGVRWSFTDTPRWESLKAWL